MARRVLHRGLVGATRLGAFVRHRHAAREREPGAVGLGRGLGTDSDLRRWGLQLAERGGKNAKKRAAVAVARKLSVLLLRLWATGEVYEPLRNARKNDQLLPTPA